MSAHIKITPPRPARDAELEAYMHDVGRYPLMTPDQERARAHTIADRRVAYWRALLSYPPFVEGIVALVAAERQDDDELTRRLEHAVKAARDVRGRRIKRFIEGYEAAIDALARRMGELDPEVLIADRIAADLDSLSDTVAGARRGITLQVASPRQGSRPYADYVHRVRAAAAALNMERNHFARANLRLVVRMAQQFRRSGLPMSDLVQEGNIGLLKAVDRFDVTRGFRFSTYAGWWIKHHIRRAVVNRARTIRLPQHIHTLSTRLGNARAELRRELGREPTDAELADKTEVSHDKINTIREALGTKSVSLDAPISETDRRSVTETLAAEPGPTVADRLDLDTWTRRLHGALLDLEPIERDILRQRFGLGGATTKTLAEIGQQYSLSRERIRQLQVAAIARMRDRLHDDEPPSIDA
jgi:RNA polymerase primary sigma factor